MSNLEVLDHKHILWDCFIKDKLYLGLRPAFETFVDIHAHVIFTGVEQSEFAKSLANIRWRLLKNRNITRWCCATLRF